MRQKNNEEFLIEYKRAQRHTFRQIERYASLFSNQNGSQISYRAIRYPFGGYGPSTRAGRRKVQGRK